MSLVELRGLEKSFGRVVALAGVDLRVESGEILALLGPSGSGKTTLLRLLGGFDRPDRGQILVDGVDVTPLAPERRRFGMVFQHYALFPHLDVEGNISFGLTDRGRSERRSRVTEVLDLVGLSGYQGRRIDELSGGQQQRVALARALAPEPRLLLLDEPLSNLDPGLRERTRGILREIIEGLGMTSIFVTHQQDEAFDLGHRVAVLGHGRLHQVGAPRELYDTPADPFVADFVGRTSRWLGVWEGEGLRLPDGTLWPAEAVDALEAGASAEMLTRPEHLELRPPGDQADPWRGRVRRVRFGGALTWVDLEGSDGRRVEVAVDRTDLAEGEEVAVHPRTQAPLARAWKRLDP